MDYMSILDVGTQKLEIVSWIPFFRQKFETLSLTKPQQYYQIQNLSYLNATMGIEYQQYIGGNLSSLEQRIDEGLTPLILSLL
jgi:hypothetical protein